jgi:hypothetical protein
MLLGLGILSLVAIPAILAMIGLQFAEDRDEEMLFLKLMGYALLGAFTFRINGFPLPIGILITLWMASNAQINQKARRVTAGIGFVLFLIGLIF